MADKENKKLRAPVISESTIELLVPVWHCKHSRPIVASLLENDGIKIDEHRLAVHQKNHSHDFNGFVAACNTDASFASPAILPPLAPTG